MSAPIDNPKNTLGAWAHPSAMKGPVPQRARTDIRQIAVTEDGDGRVCLALTVDGEVVAWGKKGERVVRQEAKSGIAQIAAHGSNVVGLTRKGEVVGVLGGQDVPQKAKSGIVGIAAADSVCLALTKDGEVIAWGKVAKAGMEVPAEAKAGVTRIAAAAELGVAWKGDKVITWGSDKKNIPQGVASRLTQVSSYGTQYCAALTTDGEVVTWKNYSWGSDSPDREPFLKVPDSAKSGIVQIAMGAVAVVALKSNGEVVHWGHDEGTVSIPHGLKHVRRIANGDIVPMGLLARVASLSTPTGAGLADMKPGATSASRPAVMALDDGSHPDPLKPVTPAPYPGEKITFTVGGAIGATFEGGRTTAVVQTDSQGRATAPPVTAGTTAGTVTVTAQADSNPDARTVFTATVTRPRPTITTLDKDTVTDQQTTGPGTSFARPLKVTVLDSQRQPVAGQDVLFTVTPPAAARFASGQPTASVTSDRAGVAIAPTLTAAATPQDLSVTASLMADPKITATFRATVSAPRPVDTACGALQNTHICARLTSDGPPVKLVFGAETAGHTLTSGTGTHQTLPVVLTPVGEQLSVRRNTSPFDYLVSPGRIVFTRASDGLLTVDRHTSQLPRTDDGTHLLDITQKHGCNEFTFAWKKVR